MQDLVENLRSVDGVKNVKRQGEDVLMINLFCREVPGSEEVVDVQGDLRSISQKLVNVLDSEVSGSWSWMVKPEKKYQETGLETESVSDRKVKGHKPGYYMVSLT